jgi:hypothetical protein
MDLMNGILAILLAMAPSVYDTEGPDARRERMGELAEIIAEVAEGRPSDAAALLTLGRFESNFAQYVGEGCVTVPKGAADCDNGRARSYWQMWQVACPAGWKTERGSREATEAFARCAVRHFRGALARCRTRTRLSYIAGGFAGYRGPSCDWQPAEDRAKGYWTLLGAIQAKLKE